MNYKQRKDLRAELAHFIAEQSYNYHVTARFEADVPIDRMEDRLRRWDARVNHYYLGRNWARPFLRSKRASGVAFFERGKFKALAHPHLLINAPDGAGAEFSIVAHQLWDKTGTAGKVAPNSMVVQYLPTTADRLTVSFYDTKELPGREINDWNWKFLDHLTSL